MGGIPLFLGMFGHSRVGRHRPGGQADRWPDDQRSPWRVGVKVRAGARLGAVAPCETPGRRRTQFTVASMRHSKREATKPLFLTCDYSLSLEKGCERRRLKQARRSRRARRAHPNCGRDGRPSCCIGKSPVLRPKVPLANGSIGKNSRDPRRTPARRFAFNARCKWDRARRARIPPSRAPERAGPPARLPARPARRRAEDRRPLVYDSNHTRPTPPPR